MAAAAVVTILIGAFVLADRSDSTEPPVPADTTTATTTAPDTPTPGAAEQVASRFIEARNAWDGETARSLLADDAVIDEVSVPTVDDFGAKVEFERIVGWRFLQPQCTTTEVGPPTEVTCTYAMENKLSQALGVGPFSGSSFEFVVVDGRIEQVTHRFDFRMHALEAFTVFTDWLDTNHPGDSDVMFDIDAEGTWIPVLTPEALARHAQRVREFDAVGTAISFVQARDAWDGETVRSLVADDATIDDLEVTTADDYLASAEFERALGWRFQRPICAATVVGPPAEVTCTYEMEDALARALDVGPYTGSSFEFVIADGQIRQLTHTFDYSIYSEQVFEVFWAWLHDAHPGDAEVIFTLTPTGLALPRLAPGAIGLLEQRTDEFVASLDDPPAD